MRGAIPPLPQYASIAWCSVKAQGQLYLHLSPLRCRKVSVLPRNFNLLLLKRYLYLGAVGFEFGLWHPGTPTFPHPYFVGSGKYRNNIFI
jgi:hypothetical protein